MQNDVLVRRIYKRNVHIALIRFSSQDEENIVPNISANRLGPIISYRCRARIKRHVRVRHGLWIECCQIRATLVINDGRTQWTFEFTVRANQGNIPRPCVQPPTNVEGVRGSAGGGNSRCGQVTCDGYGLRVVVECESRIATQ